MKKFRTHLFARFGCWRQRRLVAAAPSPAPRPLPDPLESFLLSRCAAVNLPAAPSLSPATFSR
jgi:hypothetical protein